MVKSYFKEVLACICVYFLCALQVSAQKHENLYSHVNRAHKLGAQFVKQSLFSITQGTAHEGLRNETLLKLSLNSATNLHEARPNAISLTVTTKEGKAYELEMLRSNPFSENANVGVITNGERTRMNVSDGVHYAGAIKDADGSLASLSVFANGEVMLLFAMARATL